jgi:hypothetical protein
MPDGALAERVDSLENYMKDLSYQALRTERELARLSAEMRAYKDQSEREMRAMNRRWGELANKMGTLVEDLVAPNLPRVARELFNCDEPEYFAVRPRKRRAGSTMELDALLVCTDVVLINETKSTLNARDIDEVLAKVEAFPLFFPEFAERRGVAIAAALHVDESLVRYATSRSVLVMALGDETMQVLNPEAAA